MNYCCGCDNVAIGCGAISVGSCGMQNVGIGSRALACNHSSNNVAIGYESLYYNTAGCNNIAIGCQAGYNETGSSKLHIANCSNCTLICGDFIAKTVCINAAVGVISLTCSSDCRLKSNISSISVAPIDVEYKQFNHCDTPNKLNIGVIAQELCITHPELVNTDDNGYLSVDYGELHSLEIAYLKCKVSELEKKLNSLIPKV